MDIPFDTHAAVKRLTNAGFTEPQAEALNDTVHRAVTGGVSTKADLAELRSDFAELRTDFAELRTDFAELRTEVAEQRIALRMIAGIGAGIVAVLIGVAGFGFNILLGMTEDIVTLQAAIAALQENNVAIKETLAELVAR